MKGNLSHVTSVDQVVLENRTETNTSIANLGNGFVCLAVREDFYHGLDIIIGSILEHETHVVTSTDWISRQGKAAEDEGHHVDGQVARRDTAKVTLGVRSKGSMVRAAQKAPVVHTLLFSFQLTYYHRAS